MERSRSNFRRAHRGCDVMSNTQLKPPSRVTVLVRVLAALPLLVFGVVFLRNRPPDPRPPEVAFEARTGLPWPKEAKVLRTGDSHGRDGEYYLVFDTEIATLKRWMKGPAPWNGTWKPGPVPGQIGFHCNFGTSGVSWGTPGGYSGDPEIVAVLSSARIIYAETELCCNNSLNDPLRWHSGNLLVVNPDTGRVWLSCWDY